MKDKAQTLIGFAVKAGKVCYGADNVKTSRPRIHIIIISDDIAPKSQKDIVFFASQRNIPVYKTKIHLEDIVFRANTKVIGITDKQMTQGLIKNFNDNYEHIVAEVRN